MTPTKPRPVREPYIDFMRALGLILLVGVHVNAPEWYVPMRSFDVPLMVVVSAICYKSLRGGGTYDTSRKGSNAYICRFLYS